MAFSPFLVVNLYYPWKFCTLFVLHSYLLDYFLTLVMLSIHLKCARMSARGAKSENDTQT